MGVDLHKVTDKTIEDFSGQEPDYERKLEKYDPSKNNNKFWYIWVYGKYVVRRWGRHGSKGQSAVHRSWNSWGAEEAAGDLTRAKRRDGYVDDVTTVLDHIVRAVD